MKTEENPSFWGFNMKLPLYLLTQGD